MSTLQYTWYFYYILFHFISCLILFLLPFSQKEGGVIVCNAISGRDFRLFMHMRTVYGLLVVQNKILCSHELFSSCFPNNPDVADPKSQHPEMNEAFYRSDCAGSYASGGLLVPIRHIGRLTGISIKRYDFSEPQAGKGPCDRSSAHQKSHVNRFLNEGNDVVTWRRSKRCSVCGGVSKVSR